MIYGISVSHHFYSLTYISTGGMFLTSDTNRAIARSIATHSKEEKARKTFEEELSLGKRKSLSNGEQG